MSIHNTIAEQIDHLKPAHYEPGVDVGLAVIDELSLLVVVPPLRTLAVVSYCPGPDLYSVVVSDATPKVREYEGVYCDQLGDLIFGADAEAWTMPIVAVFVQASDGTVTELEA